MKLKLIFGILVLVVFLIGAGCQEKASDVKAPATKTQSPEKHPEQATQANEQPEESPAEPEKTPEEIIAGEKLEYADRIRTEFLANVNNVKSYSYMDYSSKNFYYVKGDKIKIVLFQQVLNPPEKRYDSVYLNMADGTAFAYCSSLKGCTYEQRKQYRKVDYRDYVLTTPLDITKSIKKGDLNELDIRYIENAATRAISYTDTNNNTISVWLHNNYAFPYEIVTETPSGEKTITRYTDARFNTLTNADVNLPEDAVLVE